MSKTRPGLPEEAAIAPGEGTQLDGLIAEPEARHPGQSGFRLIEEGPEAFAARARSALLAGRTNDWVGACKGGAPPSSHFAVAGRYTEWLLLGVAAVHYEGQLLWDPDKGEITNVPEANQCVKPTYRNGWELTLQTGRPPASDP